MSADLPGSISLRQMHSFRHSSINIVAWSCGRRFVGPARMLERLYRLAPSVAQGVAVEIELPAEMPIGVAGFDFVIPSFERGARLDRPATGIVTTCYQAMSQLGRSRRIAPVAGTSTRPPIASVRLQGWDRRERLRAKIPSHASFTAIAIVSALALSSCRRLTSLKCLWSARSSLAR
jgi:hypothetical protein